MGGYEAPAQLENLNPEDVKAQTEIEKLINITNTKHQQMKAVIMRNKEVPTKFYLRSENRRFHYLLLISSV